jgi:hypothetical protein
MDLRKQLHLGQERKERLLAQIEKDVDFLTNLGIIDYSLLLGVHQVSKRGQDSIKRRKNNRGILNESGSVNSSMDEMPARELTPTYYEYVKRSSVVSNFY